MKKLFFTLALIVSSLVVANAQEVGQWWVGGSAGVWSSKNKGSDADISAKIMPEIGYAFSDNMAFGVSLGYAHNNLGMLANEIDEDLLDINVNLYTVSPFLRIAFLKGDLGSLFIDGGVGYTYAKFSGIDDALNIIEAGFRPGVAFNVSDKVSLTGKFGFLGYQHAKMGDWNNNSFGLDLNMNQFLVGAIVKF